MLASSVKHFLLNFLLVKRAYLWFYTKTVQLPDWKKLILREKEFWHNTVTSVSAAAPGQKILIATSVGRFWVGTILESILGVALTLRKTEVHFLLCDKLLPACLECRISWYPNITQFVRYGPQHDLCTGCYKPAERMLRILELKVHRYSDFVTTDILTEAERVSATIPIEDIAKYVIDGVNVGEHSVSGTLRFFARGDLDNEPFAEQVLRRFFKASLITFYVIRRLIDKYKFQTAVFHHGIYVPQGIIGTVARRYNIRVVNWNPAYRRSSFIFSHHDTYHHTLMDEPTTIWENIEWDANREKVVTEYLSSRWKGTYDWISFLKNATDNLTDINRELAVDFTKPTIGLLTNVIWDAQLHYPANAFPSMLDWLIKTIQYFSKRKDLQLIIRIHPAELTGFIPSRQRVVTEIKKKVPELPANIYLIGPESRISTYTVMQKCNAVILYGTKTGVELASTGLPIIVAGEAWIRNKGITWDARSEREYFQLLDRLPLAQRLDEFKIQRARKYAYHFFFRRMIPLEFLIPVRGSPPFKLEIQSIRDLLPGKYKGLDVILEGILEAKDFINDFVNKK